MNFTLYCHERLGHRSGIVSYQYPREESGKTCIKIQVVLFAEPSSLSSLLFSTTSVARERLAMAEAKTVGPDDDQSFLFPIARGCCFCYCIDRSTCKHWKERRTLLVATTISTTIIAVGTKDPAKNDKIPDQKRFLLVLLRDDGNDDHDDVSSSWSGVSSC